MRRRLDVELVRRGLVPSRTRAVEAIDAGRVLVGGAPASTAGAPGRRGRGDRGARRARVRRTCRAAVTSSRPGSTPSRSTCAAARASTSARRPAGSPTACCSGAPRTCSRSTSAASQLAWSLRQDARVTVMERTNVRDLEPGALDPRPICASPTCRSSRCARSRRVSLALTTDDADFVLLVKPQYEAGRARVGRRGIVRDPEVHARGVARGRRRARRGRARASARWSPSPLRGADGNVEFLVHARRGAASVAPAALDDAVRRAQDAGPDDAGPLRADARRRSRPAPRPPASRTSSRSATAAWLVEHGVEVRVPAELAAAAGLDAYATDPDASSRPVSTSRSRSAATARCSTRCSSCTRRRCRSSASTWACSAT